MNVTRLQIIKRGLLNRCPNCGGRTLFRKGELFHINSECPNCGLKIERDEGFFLGSMSLNYGVTLVVLVAPVIWLAYKGTIGTTTTVILAGAGAILFPILFYRSSRSLWLMNYYFFLPQHLPANRDPSVRTGPDDENL